MTIPKKPKGEKPPPKCVLCHEAPRPHLGFWCPRCEAHQRRAAAVVRRVNAGRKADRLTAVEERGKGVT